MRSGPGYVDASVLNSHSAGPVLIIDDAALILDATVASLQAIGIDDVQIATGGLSGIEKLDSLRPRILFVDLMMPEIGGFEVLSHVRGLPEPERPGRIVVMSAIDDSYLKTSILSLGVDHVLSKPFTLDDIKSAVHAG